MDKDRILEFFSLFSFGTTGGGIGSLLHRETDDQVFQRLASLASGNPLSLEEFNQLLLLAHEASITRDFFRYYWLTKPDHPYDVTTIAGYNPRWFEAHPERVVSIEHLKWGLYRVYVDGLLYFGNVRTAFRKLRTMNWKDLQCFFSQRRFPADRLRSRGRALLPEPIPREKRHFVSEFAYSSFVGRSGADPELKRSLQEAWQIHHRSGMGRATFGQILEGASVRAALGTRHNRIMLCAEDLLDEFIDNENAALDAYERLAESYTETRKVALRNTELYLSMVNEMDVYVATSMRQPRDFVEVADFCDRIFGDPRLTNFNLRFFDPTLSVAEGHEDKGLIECLMVKCSKACYIVLARRRALARTQRRRWP